MPNCGGTVTTGANSISLSGGNVAANANCIISVDVTGTSAGTKNNSATLSTAELGTGATAAATLTVVEPTAASATVSGRVLTAFGRGIPNTRVEMTDSNGQVRYAMTNPFGYYRFQDISVGATYIFSVTGKKHRFSPKVVTLTNQIADLNFVAVP